MSDYLTHPEWLALVRAVVTTPADNLPRLVAADWLDEHGQPERAGFIRVQVQYPEGFGGRMTPLEDPPDAPAWYCHAIDWLTSGAADAELHAVVGGRCRGIPNQHEWVRQASDKGWQLRVVWHRGFIAELRCNSPCWDRHGFALVAAHPVTRYVPTDAPRGTVMEGAIGRVRLEQARSAAGLG